MKPDPVINRLKMYQDYRDACPEGEVRARMMLAVLAAIGIPADMKLCDAIKVLEGRRDDEHAHLTRAAGALES